ncbi:MAG: DUF4349 domain-containing protein, partial [Burkholderiales bacterium]|nr:DUF4349 domain-containing protein [Burkholderiales bacterium]
MKFFLCVWLVSVFVCGCSRSTSIESKARVSANPPVTGKPRHQLAYEHSIELILEEEKIAVAFEHALATCRTTPNDGCTIMESKINSSSTVQARLKFRVVTSQVQNIIAALNQTGKLLSQSTTAEDLSGPIADTEKKLAMLRDYRGKLELLNKKTDANIEVLMKISQELARVQGEIEELSGRSEQLQERTTTEVIQVALGSTEGSVFWKPIAQSGSNFGRNLAESIAAAISALAYLLPWIVMLIMLFWGLRKMWRFKRG